MIVVQVESLDDFIAEISDRASAVVNGTVRWQTQVTPEQQENVSRVYVGWATAVVKLGEMELIEYAEQMGRDSDTTGRKDGSARTEAAKLRLRQVCDDLGLRLRPGKIESLSFDFVPEE